jgi:UDP-N-acetylmuramate dehydrogenase
MPRALPDELLALPHRRDVPFASLTTLGLGGLCHWLFEPTTEEEAQVFVRTCHHHALSYRILGAGSNLLVLSDIEEPVLRMRLPSRPERQGKELRGYASHGHIAFAEAAAGAGLSGLEWAATIPGSLGGAVRMNAGAHGGEWIQVLARYRFLTPEGELIEKAPETGEFGYRWSWLRRGQVILSATARLVEGDPARIHAAMEANRERRRATQPQGARSAGCVFKNPAGGTHAGRLIDETGLKGLRIGDAQVSPVHANFFVNLGKATPGQFQELMDRVRTAVKEKHGVELEPEVEIWGSLR